MFENSKSNVFSPLSVPSNITSGNVQTICWILDDSLFEDFPNYRAGHVGWPERKGGRIYGEAHDGHRIGSYNCNCVKNIIIPNLSEFRAIKGKLKDYLTDLMELEVKRLGEEQEALLFRENSIGSKSIESFLKLVCRTYLAESLQEVVKKVIETSADIDCEVDKERIRDEIVLS